MPQLALNLKDPRYVLPACEPDVAAGLLDLSEREVLALIDDGQIIAFNIASPDAKQRELRVLKASVAEYLRDNPDRSPCFHTMICPDDAIAQFLPAHAKPFLTLAEVTRALLCSDDHVHNLVRAGCLAAVGSCRRGPGGFINLSRESFIAFLKARPEGGPYA